MLQEKIELINRLKSKGITNERILNAIKSVPREKFVSEKSKSLAYTDIALPIKSGQTISQPFIVARMLELLELESTDKILEIGSGSGYAAALMSLLGGKVIGVDKDEDLVKSSKELLRNLGYKNIKILRGDGSKGYPPYHPYQKILVSGALPEIPEALINQLDHLGVLVAPVGDRMHQKIVKLKKVGKQITKEVHEHCIFLPIRGEYGF